MRSSRPRSRPVDVARRLLDLTIAVVLLTALSPLLLATALLIALTDGHPVLFRQERVGRGGRPFRLLKFRTMVVDAEARRLDLLDDNECDGPLFKLEHDPRVTAIGRRLRQTSIDELPQLLNVLAGHMAIVGPRPALPSEVEHFDADHRRRESVLPGITGAWQAYARDDRSFASYREWDLWYLEHRGLAVDLRILADTAVQTLVSAARALGAATTPVAARPTTRAITIERAGPSRRPVASRTAGLVVDQDAA